LLILSTTVFMASKDSILTGWLRTREQIYGGAYPGPLMQVRSRHDVEDLLINYDVRRTNSIDEAELRIRTTALRENLRLINPSAYDGLILQLARMHNCTHLLEKYPKPADPEIASTETDPTKSESALASSTQASVHTGSTQPSVDTTKTSTESISSSKSVAITSASTLTEFCSDIHSTDTPESSTKAHVATAPSNAPVESTSIPIPQVLSASELGKVCSRYKEDQSKVEGMLCAFRKFLKPSLKSRFES
jgi:hypothetical protein